MKKVGVALGFLIFLISCHEALNKQEKDKTVVAVGKNESVYPHIIDSLSLDSLYDRAKWYIYCIHCDDTLKWHPNFFKKTITLGMLPLVLDTIERRSDTLEMDFAFRLPETATMLGLDIGNILGFGVVYKKGSDSILMFSQASVARYSWGYSCDDFKSCQDRHVVPLQPEVIRYIKQNGSNIDSWFYKKAVDKKVLKEK